MRANAIELTADSAWFLAESCGAGSFPWVLAITQPYTEQAQCAAFAAAQTGQLTRMSVMTADGAVDPTVSQWIRTTCRPAQWLELRFVRGRGELLRGVIARRDDRTVVALRAADLVTFTAMDVDHPHALVPVLAAGLARQPPARFDEFSLPARVGTHADEQLRNGARLQDVMDHLGIPVSARPVVEAAFDRRRTYVEVLAGQHRDGHRITTDVGVSIVDTLQGRILVSPAQAYDGEWVSTFAPGTPLAIATAVDRLTATLPDGSWFPDITLTRDFDRTENRCPTPL
ncbi:ESX secretion-associated protein EspG [Mycobacterium sp. NPDC048908]|uniref:ESX secretion-associated protein EspG n=1 Tax=Mycobacterium sp. NPDC048908 TaxID=3364292 RepID=UPI0037207937